MGMLDPDPQLVERFFEDVERFLIVLERIERRLEVLEIVARREDKRQEEGKSID